MNTEQRQAYGWAKTHDYPSIAARYARALASAVDDLEAQLAESQRRADAAVEDIHTVYSDGLCEVCGRRDTCLMTLDRGEDGTVCHGIKFEWRGPQEAGKGESE